MKFSGDEKSEVLLFDKNYYHTIPMYGNCMTSIFLLATQVFLKLPLKFFLFFLTENQILHSNKHFPKNLCMQNVIISVHNEVLDTLTLFFFLFAN